MRSSTETLTHTFRGPPGSGLPALAGLAGVDRVDELPEDVLETERYDTDDLRLAAGGLALTLHRGAERSYWQLDLPDERLQVPAADGPEGARQRVPAELDELVRGTARRRAVRPVGRLRTTRTERRLLAVDGTVLATVRHDHVSLATIGRSTDVRAWVEVAVDGELADTLADRAAEAGLRAAAPYGAAELDRLLLPAPRRASGLPRASAGAALVTYLATQVERIAAEDVRVRHGEPDSVHQLRIAARRLRSALQGYRPLLDRQRTEPLVKDLRELGRALAPARDAEVLRERVLAGLGDLPDELRLGDVTALTTRHFARVEAEATAAALAALDGDGYVDLRERLDNLIADPPLRERALRPARKELPRHVARAARRLRDRVEHANDPDLADVDRDPAVHAARKAGKRLRYVTEVARPAVGKPAKKFGKRVQRLTSALGAHQDVVVSRPALRELGALAHTEGGNGFSFGILLGTDAEDARRIEAQLPQLWARTWRRSRRRWLHA